MIYVRSCRRYEDVKWPATKISSSIIIIFIEALTVQIFSYVSEVVRCHWEYLVCICVERFLRVFIFLLTDAYALEVCRKSYE